MGRPTIERCSDADPLAVHSTCFFAELALPQHLRVSHSSFFPESSTSTGSNPPARPLRLVRAQHSQPLDALENPGRQVLKLSGHKRGNSKACREGYGSSRVVLILSVAASLRNEPCHRHGFSIRPKERSDTKRSARLGPQCARGLEGAIHTRGEKKEHGRCPARAGLVSSSSGTESSVVDTPDLHLGCVPCASCKGIGPARSYARAA